MAQEKKVSKFEKVKLEKCGSNMWTEVHELAAKLREGETKWEDLNLDDIDIRLKWAGLFHRGKRTPKKFMMRLKLPNGEMTASQLQYLSDVLARYGEDGSADITTRAAIQLRGVQLEHADEIIKGLFEHNMTSYQTGMDSVRNLTGNPIAGVDPHELVDTRPMLYEMHNVLHNNGLGREEFANLPRKLNICVSSTRDDFPHTHINDLGYEAVRDPATGEIVYNVVIGGLFSLKRNQVAIPMNVSVTREQMIPFAEALLRVFRDNGPRQDRNKTRLIWLVDELGMDKFQEMIQEQMGGVQLAPAVHVAYDDVWQRRDLLGVHPQKQEGLRFVGACVPAGRLTAQDFADYARIAETYGDGTVRLTCEENIIFVNVPEAKVDAMLAEPLFQRHKVNPGPLARGLVSCTGAQFCGFALIETKQRAQTVAAALEERLDIPQTVRIHWTGCPNSCGQAQVADIGLMGAPAKLDGKAAEGVKIFTGGRIGEGAVLAEQEFAGVPVAEHVLLPQLEEILMRDFGATRKAGVA